MIRSCNPISDKQAGNDLWIMISWPSSKFRQIIEATAALSLGSSMPDRDIIANDSNMHSTLIETLDEPRAGDHNLCKRFVGEVDLPECTCSGLVQFVVAHAVLGRRRTSFKTGQASIRALSYKTPRSLYIFLCFLFCLTIPVDLANVQESRSVLLDRRGNRPVE